MNDKKQEVFVIGSFKVDESVNEANVNTKKDKWLNIKGIGVLKVEIYGPNEGQIPHMHIYNESGSFSTCVCLYENLYFDHGKKYKDKFNSKQLEQFVKWLDEPSSAVNDPPINNWQSASIMWQNANPECKYPESKIPKTRPKYKDMKNFRGQ